MVYYNALLSSEALAELERRGDLSSAEFLKRVSPLAWQHINFYGWRVKHKLHEAMCQRESKRLLQGVVLADDAVLGGEHAGKPGRGSENKAPFMAPVEFDGDGRPLRVRFDAIDDLNGTTLANWAKSALDPKVHLVTNGLASFATAGAEVEAHGAIIVSPRKSSDLEPFR